MASKNLATVLGAVRKSLPAPVTKSNNSNKLVCGLSAITGVPVSRNSFFDRRQFKGILWTLYVKDRTSVGGIRAFCNHKLPADVDDTESKKKQRRSSEFPEDEFSAMKYWEADFNERQETREESTEEVCAPTPSDAFYNNWECQGYVIDKSTDFSQKTVGAELTHVNKEGHATMVDVSKKSVTIRTASARAEVAIGATAFRLVKQNNIHKGDVLKVAEIAGVMGAKETSRLIPLCHPLALSQIKVHLTLNEDKHSVNIESHVTTRGQTGVEMEALTAVSVAALTVYDMIKAVTRDAQILHVRLTSKTGGARGDYFSSDEPPSFH